MDTATIMVVDMDEVSVGMDEVSVAMEVATATPAMLQALERVAVGR